MKDRTKPKIESPKLPSYKTVNKNYDVVNMEYDQRSSGYVKTGTYYGEGFANPIGTKKNEVASIIPRGVIVTDLTI